jgi:hypothetical protein
VQNYEVIWRGGDVDPEKLTVGSAMAGLKSLSDYIASLDPKTPAQTQAVAAVVANFGVIEQTRILMSLQLTKHLLIVVVAWSFADSDCCPDSTQRHCSACVWRLCGGQRDISNSRTQCALYGFVPHFAGGD